MNTDWITEIPVALYSWVFWCLVLGFVVVSAVRVIIAVTKSVRGSIRSWRKNRRRRARAQARAASRRVTPLSAEDVNAILMSEAVDG